MTIPPRRVNLGHFVQLNIIFLSRHFGTLCPVTFIPEPSLADNLSSFLYARAVIMGHFVRYKIYWTKRPKMTAREYKQLDKLSPDDGSGIWSIAEICHPCLNGSIVPTRTHVLGKLTLPLDAAIQTRGVFGGLEPRSKIFWLFYGQKTSKKRQLDNLSS